MMPMAAERGYKKYSSYLVGYLEITSIEINTEYDKANCFNLIYISIMKLGS